MQKLGYLRVTEKSFGHFYCNNVFILKNPVEKMNKVELRYGLREDPYIDVITEKQSKSVRDTYDAAKKYIESIGDEVGNERDTFCDIFFYHVQGCSVSLLLKSSVTLPHNSDYNRIVHHTTSVKIVGEKDLAGIVKSLLRAAPKLKRQSGKAEDNRR